MMGRVHARRNEDRRDSALPAPIRVDATDGIEGRALVQMEMRELVDAARHGDREAFEALVRASSRRLYAIAYRILRDVDLANDALQEALVKIWEDLPALRDPDRYDPWTYRITCRACYRIAKRERRGRLTTLVEPLTPESSAFESEIADHDEMERGFRRLSPEHRAVLVLHYYLGLTIGEVAGALRIAPGTVGSRLHYAMRSLQASLESETRSTEAMERSR